MNESYIAGFLENVGTFFMAERKNPKTGKVYPVPFFIVQVYDKQKVEVVEDVFEYIKKDMRIGYNKYDEGKKVTWKVSMRHGLRELLAFMERNCIMKKSNQDVMVDFFYGRYGQNWKDLKEIGRHLVWEGG